jgi:hypothetical protein
MTTLKILAYKLKISLHASLHERDQLMIKKELSQEEKERLKELNESIASIKEHFEEIGFTFS